MIAMRRFMDLLPELAWRATIDVDNKSMATNLRRRQVLIRQRR